MHPIRLENKNFMILLNVMFDIPCPATGSNRNRPDILYGPVIVMDSQCPINSKIEFLGSRSKPLKFYLLLLNIEIKLKIIISE